MRKLISLFFAGFCLVMGAGAVKADHTPANTWVHQCHTDSMTDDKMCQVAFLTPDTEHGNAIAALFIGVWGKDQYMVGLAEAGHAQWKVAGIRIDKNDAWFTNRCRGDFCLFSKPASMEIVHKLSAGKEVILRLESQTEPRRDFHLPLGGFQTALNLAHQEVGNAGTSGQK